MSLNLSTLDKMTEDLKSAKKRASRIYGLGLLTAGEFAELDRAIATSLNEADKASKAIRERTEFQSRQQQPTTEGGDTK